MRSTVGNPSCGVGTAYTADKPVVIDQISLLVRRLAGSSRRARPTSWRVWPDLEYPARLGAWYAWSVRGQPTLRGRLRTWQAHLLLAQLLCHSLATAVHFVTNTTTSKRCFTGGGALLVNGVTTSLVAFQILTCSCHSGGGLLVQGLPLVVHQA